jgi:hypothetical protein
VVIGGRGACFADQLGWDHRDIGLERPREGETRDLFVYPGDLERENGSVDRVASAEATAATNEGRVEGDPGAVAIHLGAEPSGVNIRLRARRPAHGLKPGDILVHPMALLQSHRTHRPDAISRQIDDLGRRVVK